MTTPKRFSHETNITIRFAVVALLAVLIVPVLVSGAKVPQGDSPPKGLDIYLVAFHPMKQMPSHQMEVHHYCRQMNEDFAQCALFDGNAKDANLNGIEYIISEKLFDALPRDEKKYWHPHNYEILSGELAAPGMPSSAEHALMGGKMNSYGKTWHVWKTRSMDGPGDQLPLGEPVLAWSFNHDGEIKPGLVESRDKEMGIDSNALKMDRKDFISGAHSQDGVDALKRAFPGVQPSPGVRDSGATLGQ